MTFFTPNFRDRSFTSIRRCLFSKKETSISSQISTNTNNYRSIATLIKTEQINWRNSCRVRVWNQVMCWVTSCSEKKLMSENDVVIVKWWDGFLGYGGSFLNYKRNHSYKHWQFCCCLLFYSNGTIVAITRIQNLVACCPIQGHTR